MPVNLNLHRGSEGPNLRNPEYTGLVDLPRQADTKGVACGEACEVLRKHYVVDWCAVQWTIGGLPGKTPYNIGGNVSWWIQIVNTHTRTYMQYGWVTAGGESYIWELGAGSC